MSEPTALIPEPSDGAKKRGRPPKIVVPPELKDSGVPPIGKRLTEWESSIFKVLVENSMTISRETIEKASDEDAATLGLMVLACMQEPKFWVKRNQDKKYDFVMRFNLEEVKT